jgi:hypothetical protein
VVASVAHTALKVIRETGTNMSRRPTEKHVTSWLSLCPDNRESAGRRKSGKTRPGRNRVATAPRIAAQALHHSLTRRARELRYEPTALPTTVNTTPNINHSST